MLALKVDEFSVRLKKYKSLRVKLGGSFSIQIIVTSISLVERYKISYFFVSLIFGVKDFNSDDGSRHFFEWMVLIYENIRKQFTVRRRHISEDGNLSKFEKKN